MFLRKALNLDRSLKYSELLLKSKANKPIMNVPQLYESCYFGY